MRREQINITIENYFSNIDNQIESYNNGEITFCSMISGIESSIQKLVILDKTNQKSKARILTIFDTILLQASQPYTTNIGKLAHQIIMLYWQINSISHSERLKAAHPLIIENAKDPLVSHFLLMVFQDTVILNAETAKPLADSNL